MTAKLGFYENIVMGNSKKCGKARGSKQGKHTKYRISNVSKARENRWGQDDLSSSENESAAESDNNNDPPPIEDPARVPVSPQVPPVCFSTPVSSKNRRSARGQRSPRSPRRPERVTRLRLARESRQDLEAVEYEDPENESSFSDLSDNAADFSGFTDDLPDRELPRGDRRPRPSYGEYPSGCRPPSELDAPLLGHGALKVPPGENIYYYLYIIMYIQ